MFYVYNYVPNSYLKTTLNNIEIQNKIETFVDKEEAKQEIYEALINNGFDPRYYFFTNKASDN